MTGQNKKIVLANWKKSGQLADMQELINWHMGQLQQGRPDALLKNLKLHIIFCFGDQWWSAFNSVINAFPYDDLQNQCYSWGWQDICLSADVVSKPRYVIVGHHDRRVDDDHAAIKHKIQRALSLNIIPVICVTSAADAQKILDADLSKNYAKKVPLIVAFEPPVSIGQNKLLPWSDLQQQISAIRDLLTRTDMDDVYLLYGGNVKIDNVENIARNLTIDGLMLGRSSLPLADFWSLVNVYNNVF